MGKPGLERVSQLGVLEITGKGIIPRFLSDIFAEKTNRRKINDIHYRLSFVELKGKDVIDLLTTRKRKIVNINNHNAFKNITIVNVENEDETLRKILEGEARRSIVKNTMYPVSHLGAVVITFHVSNASLIKSQAFVATSKIHIVEMAGTGTAGSPSNCWKTATDLGMANLMRMQVEQYFVYLRKQSACMYAIIRSNNLLKLLKDAFGITSVIRFVSHVRIASEDLDVTLSTMRLSGKIAKLKPIKTIRHIQSRTELIVQQLREEVNELKKELELNNMFLHQEALSNISKLRSEQINRDIMNFLEGSISELTLFNVTQARLLIKVAKQLFDNILNRLYGEQAQSDRVVQARKRRLRSKPANSFEYFLSKSIMYLNMANSFYEWNKKSREMFGALMRNMDIYTKMTFLSYDF
ncbi:Kinesin-like protein KIF9 [Camponotus floridanus]|uniref:Kinesin-like protein KIF9 n=1 Tax=Camponotus floridanus TaxID=104421 RepID=E2A260_CAMFO|nr:Kinesin-like protein KIF9 [Camponotus floridanus]